MTSSERTTSEEVHTLTGAYVADALSDTERAQFERHLSACSACAQEVRELQETVARLAASEATAPRDALRAQVMAEVARTRQLPPVRRSPAVPRRPVPRWLLVAAVVLGIALAGAGVLTASLRQQLEHAQATNADIVAALAAPDAQTAVATAPDGAQATVLYSRQRGHAVVVPVRLRNLPDDRTYQLWLLGPGDPRSAGLLNRPDTQSTVKAALNDVTALGITVEPAGGSRQPTTKPVLVVAMPT